VGLLVLDTWALRHVPGVATVARVYPPPAVQG
jgi:hypothetical protein